MKDYTVEFLRAVAERLSGRGDCKQVEYSVIIGQLPNTQLDETYQGKIIFYPVFHIYPDMHHRKSTDLVDVVDHIMRTQFRDTVYDHDDEYGHARFKEGSLTTGGYKYMLSVDKKKRKWVREI